MKTKTAENIVLEPKGQPQRAALEPLGHGVPVGGESSSLGLIGASDEVERVCAHFDAVLLYGSCARGDATTRSDIDLLALDNWNRPRLRLPDQFSLTVYPGSHLRRMALRGSLFVLHLRQEAKVLADRAHLLPAILGLWVPPDYARLREGMRAAVTALDLASRSVPASRLRRITLFVLRSVLYAACAERGHAVFAMASVAHVLNDSAVARFFDAGNEKSDDCVLAESRALFRSYLGHPSLTDFGDLEALAVSWRTHFPMASHIAAQILTQGTEVSYTSAPVDWVPE